MRASDTANINTPEITSMIGSRLTPECAKKSASVPL